MKVIWTRGTATVRDVYEALLQNRKIAYTTVMTMMGVLEGKGHLRKTSGEKAHVYEPVKPKQEVIGSMVTDFVTRVFDGAAKPLLLHLLDSRQLTPEELEEIRRIVRKKS